MKYSLLLLSLIIFSSCGSNDDDNGSPQQEVSTPDVNASKVSYWDRSGYDAAVFLPSDYGTDPNKEYPLVISLYGLGGSVLNAEHTDVGGERSGFIKQVWDTPLALSYPAIVIAPEVGVANSDERTFWNARQLLDLLQEAKSKYQIDDDRVVVTGFSAGSIAVQELALRNKDTFAGIMPGAFDAVIKANLCELENFPVWSFGNTSDVLFQAASWRGVQNDIANCSGYTEKFVLTINDNQCGHDCWDDHWARPDVQTWLHSQER